MSIEEKLNKICEMFKELNELEAIDEVEVDKLYFHLKFCIETIKELKGSDKE